MGSAVIAYCKCGYNDGFSIGGGMMNAETVCLFPCLCSKCNRIVEVNLLRKQLVCSKCKSPQIVPYDDPTLRKRKGRREVTSWALSGPNERMLILANGYYYCPACDSFHLKFDGPTILWD